MSRLWIAVAAALTALFFYAAGCSDRGIDQINVDGGTGCSGLDEKSCLAAGSACVADYCAGCSCTQSQSFAGCRRPSDAHVTCPESNCPSCPVCDGLPESQCVAAEQTLGCTPDYCPDCQGGQSFVGCSPPGGGGNACPATCAVQTCRNNQDCKSFDECVAPGASPGCGICMTGVDCASDGDCPSGQICGSGDCICTPSGRACVTGCAQSGCAEGQMCGNSDHCIPVACLKVADCPAQFSCNEGSCIRKPCSADSDCPGGFCVENQCYSALGQCQPEPA